MHVNSAVHPIAIASKTVTGQHGPVQDSWCTVIINKNLTWI